MNTIPIRPLLTLKLATLAALAFLMLLLNGCHWVGVRGNGKVKTDSRAVSNFTKLETDGAFTINWTPGPASLKITTDSNLFEYIRTDVSDDRLRIEWVKPLKGTRGIKVEVASPSLTRVTLNGAVKLTASNLSGTEFYLDANGATKAVLTGNVNAMSGELNGASKLDAESLVTRAMELSINGAGKASVNATEALKVSISGAGKVTAPPGIRPSRRRSTAREVSGSGTNTFARRRCAFSAQMSATNDDKSPAGFSYNTRLNILHGPLEVIDVPRLVAACQDQWYNQTLCRVDEAVVRLGIVEGEYHWHHHEEEDEFFYVVSGRFLIDLEDRTVDLAPGNGFVVPKGVKHRPRAPERTVVLMVERAGIIPTGKT